MTTNQEDVLKKRQLGSSDLEFTTIGLGTWAIGGPWQWGWSDQDDDDSIATIRRALDLGINWIDTAAAYGLGHSEEIVGRAIAGRRDEVYVATKCGLTWDDRSQMTVFNRLKAWSVRKEVEGSLRRLDTDYIDLYQIHWPNPETDIEEAWTEMAKMVDEGLVRYIGVSNFSPAQVDRVRKIYEVASHQPPYSMLHRDIEQELLPYCGRHDIGVVTYGSIQSGLLTGKYTPEKIEQLPDDDWRHHSDHFEGEKLKRNLRIVERLRPIAGDLGISLPELAISWILLRDEATSAIVGARRPDQVEAIVGGGDFEIPEDARREIAGILETS